jgi:hypothetical protein
LHGRNLPAKTIIPHLLAKPTTPVEDCMSTQRRNNGGVSESAPEPDSQDHREYALTGERLPPGPPPGAASPEAPSAPIDQTGSHPVLPYRRADRAAAPATDLYFPSKPRDLYLPAGLLAAGMGLGFAELIHLEGDAVRAAKAATVFFVMQAIFLLVAMPLLTRVVGVAFGTLPQAVLKFCAIATLPAAGAVGVGLLAGGCLGVVLVMPFSFAACWTMFAVLFELDLTESRLCAALYWAVGAVIGTAIGWPWFWLWDLL